MGLRQGSDHARCLAIVAGSGILPELLVQECDRKKQPCHIVRLTGVRLDWLQGRPVIDAALEQLGKMFSDMRDAGCDSVVFAGTVVRPVLDPTRFDAGFRAIAPQLLSALKGGDDDTLRVIVAAFEAAGFNVIGAHEILCDLLSVAGNLTRQVPSAADMQDIARAEEIVHALGLLDVGQGAVVAQGLCLAVESIQGTDQMLGFVTRTATALRPDPDGAKGVLFKAPKPAQDLRVDLPTIGPETVRHVASAGLAGIAIRANGVLLLDRKETIERANQLGLFITAVDVPIEKS